MYMKFQSWLTVFRTTGITFLCGLFDQLHITCVRSNDNDIYPHWLSPFVLHEPFQRTPTSWQVLNPQVLNQPSSQLQYHYTKIQGQWLNFRNSNVSTAFGEMAHGSNVSSKTPRQVYYHCRILLNYRRRCTTAILRRNSPATRFRFTKLLSGDRSLPLVSTRYSVQEQGLAFKTKGKLSSNRDDCSDCHQGHISDGTVNVTIGNHGIIGKEESNCSSWRANVVSLLLNSRTQSRRFMMERWKSIM